MSSNVLFGRLAGAAVNGHTDVYDASLLDVLSTMMRTSGSAVPAEPPKMSISLARAAGETPPMSAAKNAAAHIARVQVRLPKLVIRMFTPFCAVVPMGSVNSSARRTEQDARSYALMDGDRGT